MIVVPPIHWRNPSQHRRFDWQYLYRSAILSRRPVGYWRLGDKQTYSQNIVDLNPVGYWRLGESSGTNAADSSGNANDGTYVNSPTFSVDGAIQMDSDTAVDLDHTVPEYVTTPFIVNPASNFTACMWFKVDALGTAGPQTLIQQMDGSGSGRSWLYVDDASQYSTNGLASFIGNEGTGGATTIAIGVWYFGAVVVSGTNIKLYLNGQEDASNTVTPESCIGTLRFGLHKAGNSPFNGSIDEIAIFDSVLTSTQILDLYNQGVGKFAKDESGGGNIGTYVGEPTIQTAGAPYILGSKSVSLDGSTQYVDFDDIFGFSGDVPFSVIAWVNRSALSGSNFPTIVANAGRTGGQNTGWNLIFRNTDEARFARNDGSGGTLGVTGTTVTTTGVWYMVVGVYDGNAIHIYLNGVKEASTIGNSSIADFPTSLTIGRKDYDASPEWLNAIVDEVAIFDYALSASEILKLYRIGRGYFI